MKPISFPQMNSTFAKDQPEYVTLPARRDQDGTVTSCWHGRFWERIVFLFTGKMWLRQLTFNTPMQYVRLSVISHFGCSVTRG
jgi:hypothetical protein